MEKNKTATTKLWNECGGKVQCQTKMRQKSKISVAYSNKSKSFPEAVLVVQGY